MNRAAILALTPLSVVYGIGVRIRNNLHQRGILKTSKVDALVISVGNLTTGGTGKTPLVAWIADRLAKSEHRVCIITRGYGRTSSGRVVVADGDKILADVNQAGDEPLLLAQKLCGRAAVICDADRVAAARWAIDNLKTGAIVLDDAFQHQSIQRDLNILIIDATSPWGNRKLLPAGSLREPISGLSRADCIVITRAGESKNISQLRDELARLAPSVAVFLSDMQTVEVRLLNAAAAEPEVVKLESPVAAFCAIGNPNSFFALLRRGGYQLNYERAFRDHYRYRQADIDQFVRDAVAHGAKAIFTTAKDAVKLKSLHFDLPCYVMDISIAIDQADKFEDYFNRSRD